MALTEIRDTAFDAAKQIAHAFDGSLIGLQRQVLFQRKAYHIRALAAQAFCGAV